MGKVIVEEMVKSLRPESRIQKSEVRRQKAGGRIGESEAGSRNGK
jgi:hypothetical protein